MNAILAISAGLAWMVVSTSPALAADKLKVLCGVDEAWCSTMKAAFEARSGLTVAIERRSTGEILDQLRAEKDHPTVDVWWGGTGDIHLQATSENLLEPYTSPNEADVLPWAQNFFTISGGQSAGIYAGALGFAYNSVLVTKAGLPAPNCWKDLTNEAYRGRILAGNPNHLLGLILAADVAAMKKDAAAEKTYHDKLVAAASAERAKQLPEYVTHENDITAALEAKRR